MKITRENYPWLIGAGVFAALGADYVIDPYVFGPRSKVAGIMNGVVPSKYPDANFQAVTGGKFAPGYGSSCGFLPSYLWSELGVTNCLILNRDFDDCTYIPGANISKIVNGGKVLGCYVNPKDAPGEVPQRGDVIFCSNGPPNTEHVFVFDRVEGDQWFGWDGGHPAADEMNTSQRTVDLDNYTLAFYGGPRTIQGWVDLELLLQNY